MRRPWDKLKRHLKTYIADLPSEKSSSGLDEFGDLDLEILQTSNIYPLIYDLIKSETKRSPRSISIFLGGCEADFPFQLIFFKIQELCEVYRKSGRPVTLYIGEWFSEIFQQEQAIASLFTALNTESTLVIDTGIYQDGNYGSLNLGIGYWQKNSQTYRFNNQNINFDDLALAQSPQIETPWVQFREDWLEVIPSFIEIVISLQLDQHFLIMDFPPLLPQLLPKYLIQTSASEEQNLKEAEDLFTIHYQNLYQILSLDLKQVPALLANLGHFQDQAFVKSQVIQFMETWFQSQNIQFPSNSELEDLVILMQSAFKLEEWVYIQKLNICFNVINANCHLNLMNILAKAEFEFTVPRMNAQGQVRRSRTNLAKFFSQPLEPNLDLEMVYIPSGIFRMGSPRPEVGHEPAESPMHWVAVSTFFMGKYPITQAQWQAIAELPIVNKPLQLNPSEFQGLNRPVENISWHDAVEFCDRLTLKTGIQYRLPTEAEWEYACRAGTKTPFYFGETITSEFANYDGTYPYGFGSKGEYRQYTTDVGSFNGANEYGLYDMHGQVLEWCADPWHEDYENAPNDSKSWQEPTQDPDNRVLRGGSWFNVAGRCRAASRHQYGADIWLNHVGFRVALSI
jgi:formylglycine-generating enzyme required for sulfatase activity